MIKSLKERATQLELMDDLEAGGPELQQAYRHLRRLNRIFSAASPILYGMKRLWEASGRPKRLTILDIGAGSGEVNKAVLTWAERKGIDVNITAVDVSEEACAEARRIYRDEPRIKVSCGDLFAIEDECADIVTASQFTHHFSQAELPNIVEKLLRTSRVGVVINDIHRHLVPWMTVWAVTRLISKNRYIRHDGPLSVAKGFQLSDWRELRSALQLEQMHVSWRPLYRYAVVIPKSDDNQPAEWS